MWIARHISYHTVIEDINRIRFHWDEIYNLAAQSHVAVSFEEQELQMELTELAKKTVGFQGEIIMDASKPDGTMRKLTDISRIKALGWEAKILIEKKPISGFRINMKQEILQSDERKKAKKVKCYSETIYLGNRRLDVIRSS